MPFKKIEEERKLYWEKYNIYRESDYTFSIDSPPPSISGKAHMGTAFGYILKDIIARYKRILGEKVFYPLGYDDNGSPTIKLLEKKLKKKIDTISFKESIDIIKKEEKDFGQLFIDMGLSHDSNLQYQTIDHKSQKIAQDSFLDLYKKGLIYRSNSPVIWDTKDQTALAQTDIEDLECTAEMHYIKFTTQKDDIIIATTRPELLPAVVAIFVHPQDKKYIHLINSYAFSPLFNTKVQILADEKVDPLKGSGAVMCCTFGDTTDIYWWKQHKLDTKVLFTKYGTISDKILTYTDHKIAKKMVGLKIQDARMFILQHLDVLKSETITHKIKISERSSALIEYILSPQWMLKITTFKEQFKQQVEKINWHPKHSKSKIYQWIDALSWDWCVSRQKSFGIPIPIWNIKDSDEVILVKNTPVNTLAEYPENHENNVLLNTETFDTWFTSSLTPQINSNDLFLKEPMSLRIQGSEIIRTWAFYTIIKAYLHNDIIPWHNIVIHGWCLSENKTKMSKSKGNIISPVNIMKQYGSDALRYWASTASFGNDVYFTERIVLLGKKIIMKLQNATKFIVNFNHNPQSQVMFEIDKWIIQEANQLKNNITQHMKTFNYFQCREEIDKFFLEIFCDQYIEIVKSRAYNDSNIFTKQESDSAIKALYYVLELCLLVYSPILPFMTDHLWMNVLNKLSSIHIRGSLNFKTIKYDIQNTQQVLHMIETINTVRKLKSTQKMPLNAPIDTITIKHKLCDSMIKDLKSVLKCNIIKYKKT